MGRKVSRHKAIAALIATPTIKAAAEQVGVAEKTMHQWMHDPDFAHELQRVQDDMTRYAMRQVFQAVGQALAVLGAIMADTEQPAMPRVIAAKTILEQAVKVYDYTGTRRRLNEREDMPVIVLDFGGVGDCEGC